MSKQQLGPAFAAAVLFNLSAVPAQPVHDRFYWIGEMNRASAVMVVDTEIVDRKLGRTIAEAVAKVIQDGEQPGAARSDDYLRVEPLLIAAGGPEVTRLQSGRSRQEMYSTTQRLESRETYLETNMKTLFFTSLRRGDEAGPECGNVFTMEVDVPGVHVGRFGSET